MVKEKTMTRNALLLAGLVMLAGCGDQHTHTPANAEAIPAPAVGLAENEVYLLSWGSSVRAVCVQGVVYIMNSAVGGITPMVADPISAANSYVRCEEFIRNKDPSRQ